MKTIHYYILTAALCLSTLTSCTDLDETLYDQVGTQNYYNTKNDVLYSARSSTLFGASKAAMS